MMQTRHEIRAIGRGPSGGSRLLKAALLAAVAVVLPFSSAADEKISNRVAVFSGIDKITGRIHTFDVYID